MELLDNIDLEQEKKAIVKEYRGLMKSIRVPMEKSDRKMIRQAFDLASDAHKDMRRKSGEAYIFHPLAVARIVADEMGLGPAAVVCALLHDTVEDTEITLEDIQNEFGARVAEIIDGLTKISGVFDLKSSMQAENFRKLLLTLAKDVRVILVKIADRLHNMRTMQSMPRHKQLKIASETSFLYAPLAHRLGLYVIKSELEDLSMKFTQPEMYQGIAKKLQATKRERARFINEFTKPVKEKLEEAGIQAHVFGRPKSIHSIYNKMKNKKIEFEEVYDLFAIRVIIQAEKEKEKALCWAAYSIVTDSYQPNPERLRDWISLPKGNGYESLHTTVMGPKGRWVEVQIRTNRMDEIAERGFAAHWKYKEGSSDSGLDDWLARIREILQNPESNALDFINDFKLNLFEKEIYVFTPKGELKMMSARSTALDFAYDVHTDIGNTCLGAKVNHKLVPISHKLKNGDQVEIITSKKQKPTEDWLKFAETGRAKSKIKQALKEEKKRIASDGKEMVDRKMNNLKVNVTSEQLQELATYYKFDSVLDFYVSIAKKKIIVRDFKDFVVNGKFVVPKPKSAIRKEKRESTNTKAVKSRLKEKEELLIFGDLADKINYSLANCCKPIPGDDVFGFVTVNGAIKIHRTNCPNAEQMMSRYGYRIIKTRWNKKEEIAFLTALKIIGLDDVGVINMLTTIISGEMKLNMRSMSMESKEGIFEGNILVYVNDTHELNRLISRLKEINGIHSVSRMN